MGRLAGRVAVALAVAAILAVLVLAALGFLCAALYLGLERVVEPPAAALLTGVIVLAVAIVLAALAIVAASLAGRRAAGGQPRDAVGLAVRAGEALGVNLRTLAKDHSRPLVLSALAAGFAVGVSPRLRRALLRLLG